MEFRNRLFACLFLTLVPAPAMACSCAPLSLGFCQQLPDTSNATRAVFVGKVIEVYPKSRDEMNRLVEEFARTHRDLQEALRAQYGDTSGRSIAGASSSPEVEWTRQIIEYVWGDRLTPTERDQLRVVHDRDELNRLGFDTRRRVRPAGGRSNRRFESIARLESWRAAAGAH